MKIEANFFILKSPVVISRYSPKCYLLLQLLVDAQWFLMDSEFVWWVFWWLFFFLGLGTRRILYMVHSAFPEFLIIGAFTFFFFSPPGTTFKSFFSFRGRLKLLFLIGEVTEKKANRALNQNQNEPKQNSQNKQKDPKQTKLKPTTTEKPQTNPRCESMDVPSVSSYFMGTKKYWLSFALPCCYKVSTDLCSGGLFAIVSFNRSLICQMFYW